MQVNFDSANRDSFFTQTLNKVASGEGNLVWGTPDHIIGLWDEISKLRCETRSNHFHTKLHFFNADKSQQWSSHLLTQALITIVYW